jgi:5S rRNA maturation endonuclease (ribonuclease M5)
MTTRKGWTPPTLAARGVTQEGDHGYVFTTIDATGNVVGTERYWDDGRTPKTKVDTGSKRDLWPAPETIEGDDLKLVEGPPDVLSMAELGHDNTTSIPGVGKNDPAWPARIAAGRERVYLFPDCDEVGRRRMRALAQRIAAEGALAFMVDLDRTRTDGYDVGDVLADAIAYDADRGRETARRIVDGLIAKAERVGPGGVPDPAPPPAPATPWPAPLHDDAFHGLAGQFVRTIGPHSEADPAALLVQFLAVLVAWSDRGAVGPSRPSCNRRASGRCW